MLDGDGTDLHAGHAGCAGPEGFMRDDASHHRLVVILGLFMPFTFENFKLVKDGVFAQDFITAFEECLFGSQDNLLGEEWLVRVCSGTDGVAAATLGTGITI